MRLKKLVKGDMLTSSTILLVNVLKGIKEQHAVNVKEIGPNLVERENVLIVRALNPIILSLLDFSLFKF